MACPFSVTERSKRTGLLYIRPCGSCMSCRIAHRTDWEFRIYQETMLEFKKNNYSTFATLTYNDNFLPYTINGEPTLNNSHIDKFISNLKYASQKKFNRTFKTYIVTEYGDQFGRPHAHAIIMGLNPEYRNLVAYAWLKGHVLCLPVLSGGIRYVLKYMDKQIFQDEKIKEVYGDRTPPKSWKSHGIGKDYIIEHAKELIENDGYVFHGVKYPLSPYMKDYLENFTPNIRKQKNYVDKKIMNLAKQDKLSYLDEKNLQDCLKELRLLKTSLSHDGVADHDRINDMEYAIRSIRSSSRIHQKTIKLAEMALGVS